MTTQLNVPLAFELLLEEIESVINEINHRGSEAFEKGRHADARRHLDDADKNTSFRSKLVALRNEWSSLHPAHDLGRSVAGQGEEEYAASEDFSRLPKGVRTPERAFRLPLLRAVEALGGAARTREVIDKMEAEVTRFLRPIDFQPLPSDPKSTRWRNTAQWTRLTLVEEGLLEGNSPNGIWQITAKGRQSLRITPRTTSGLPRDVPELEVSKQHLLAAARPVRRIRGISSGRMRILFDGVSVSFDFGDCAMQAPAKGYWPGVALADARPIFKWLRKPGPGDSVRVAISNGFLEINDLRSPAIWQSP